MRTLNENIIVVDLKTTGLDPQRHAVIQIGAVRLDPCSLEERDSFTANVRPWGGSDWTIEAERVHGVCQDTANAFPVPLLSVGSFGRWLAKIGRYNLAGWNVSFDIGFLRAAFTQCLMPFTPYHPIDIWTAWQGAYLAGAVDYKASSLRKWCEAFDVKCGDKHDALEDARLAAEALRRLAKGAEG